MGSGYVSYLFYSSCLLTLRASHYQTRRTSPLLSPTQPLASSKRSIQILNASYEILRSPPSSACLLLFGIMECLRLANPSTSIGHCRSATLACG